MKTLIFLAILLFPGTAVDGHGKFNGVWIDDLGTQTGTVGFDKFSLIHGVFECLSCSPKRKLTADGKPHRMNAADPLIAQSVTILGPRAIRTKDFGREMTRDTTMTVSQNNETATYTSRDKWPGVKKLLRTEYLAKRTAPAPLGANAVSGSWAGVRYVSVPEEYRSVELKEMNGYFSRANFRHGHYTVKIGGNVTPILGDGKNIFLATVRAPDARTRVETIFLGNKPIVVRTYQISEDGATLQTLVSDLSDGSVFSTTAHRRGMAN